MKKCQKCGADMEDEEEFCSSCGARYEAPKEPEENKGPAEASAAGPKEPEHTVYCMKCGAAVPESTQFCPKCGQPMGSAPKKKKASFDPHKIMKAIDAVPYRVLQIIIIVLVIALIVMGIRMSHSTAASSANSSDTIAELSEDDKFPNWASAEATASATEQATAAATATAAPTPSATATAASGTVVQITAWPTDGYCTGIPAPQAGTFAEGYADSLGNREILLGNITFAQAKTYIETVKNAGFNQSVQETGSESAGYGFMSANTKSIVFECIYQQNQVLLYFGDMDHATDGIAPQS
jgi:RNA polymerase subunit RPABC4/transcription elongation factor Spt4